MDLLAADSFLQTYGPGISAAVSTLGVTILSFLMLMWGRDRVKQSRRRVGVLEAELKEVRSQRSAGVSVGGSGSSEPAPAEPEVPHGLPNAGEDALPDVPSAASESPASDRASRWAPYALAVALALITFGGNFATGYLARSAPNPPDCVAYVEHLVALDDSLDGDAEDAFGRAVKYENEAAQCGEPAAILASIGGD